MIRRLELLPPNFDAFIEEIGAGVGELYGSEARAEYRTTAPRTFAISLEHPGVMMLGHFESAVMTGLLLGVRRKGLGEISFIHVLSTHRHRGIEGQLVREAVHQFRSSGTEGIVCENVPFGALSVGPAFDSLGFRQIPRLLMLAPLDSPGLLSANGEAGDALQPAQWPEAASCIVDAYRNHPGRVLHQEVHDVVNAVDFLTRVFAGNYGRFAPDFARASWRGGLCSGTILGCQVAPGVGFVLQVAVRRSCQGAGIGTALIKELASAYRRAGLDRMALGVTASNPARWLYDRLGFKILRDVDAYVWWRDDALRDTEGT